MTTITLPPEVEGPLVEEARKRGTTPELLAIDCPRERFPPPPPDEGTGRDGTLFDFLAGYTGTVDGTSEALSEDTGRRFVEGLVKKHDRERA